MGRVRLLSRCAVLCAALCALLVLSSCSSNRSAPSSSASTSPAAQAVGAGTTRFGTLASPCGKGHATGATDQGVTDSTIDIAYGDDAGYSGDPGVTEMSDAVKAFMKWCNDQGGILGRQVVGQYYDAAVFNVVPQVKQACKTAFMLVGEGWALDEAGEEFRVGCNLPAVPAYTAGVDIANGPEMFQPAPNPDDYLPASDLFQIAKLFPAAVKAAAPLNTTLSSSQVSIAKVLQAGTEAGFQWLNCNVTLNFLGEPDYLPYAQKFKSCGAKLIFSNQPPGPLTYDLLTAMDQLNYHPIILGEADVYGVAMAQWNTAGFGNNVYVRQAFQPLENASVVPAVNQYLSVVHASGGKVGQLGEQAASAFLLWATAAKECGSHLTRQCMVNELSQIHSWDGGGLQATADPGNNMPAACGMLVKLTGTAWSQVYPQTKGQMECSPNFVVKITGAAVGTTLNSSRLSTKFLGPSVILPQK